MLARFFFDGTTYLGGPLTQPDLAVPFFHVFARAPLTVQRSLKGTAVVLACRFTHLEQLQYALALPGVLIDREAEGALSGAFAARRRWPDSSPQAREADRVCVFIVAHLDRFERQGQVQAWGVTPGVLSYINSPSGVPHVDYLLRHVPMRRVQYFDLEPLRVLLAGARSLWGRHWRLLRLLAARFGVQALSVFALAPAIIAAQLPLHVEVGLWLGAACVAGACTAATVPKDHRWRAAGASCFETLTRVSVVSAVSMLAVSPPAGWARCTLACAYVAATVPFALVSKSWPEWHARWLLARLCGLWARLFHLRAHCTFIPLVPTPTDQLLIADTINWTGLDGQLQALQPARWRAG